MMGKMQLLWDYSRLATYLARQTFFRFFGCFLLLFLVSAPLAFSHSSKVSADTLQVADYEKLAKRYRYDKPDSALFFAQKGLQLADKTRDLRGRAAMLNQLGMMDDNEGRPTESRKKYLEAVALYKKAGDPKGQAAVTIRLGVVELRKGRYDQAISYFLEALRISTKSGHKAGIMEANVTLAEGYMGQRDYVTALEYLKTAEKLDAELPFSSLSLNICNNFGTVYKETKRFTQAIKYLKKGIAKSEVPEMQGLNITLVNNLATVYARLGMNEESIKLQKEALAKARQIHNYLRELQTLTGLAASYGSRPEAVEYLRQALQLVRKKGDRKPETEILSKLSKIYKDQGDLRRALELKEQELAIADSFFYKKMSRQIENLEAAQELTAARAKVHELKYQNSRQQLEKVVIIGVSVSVFLLMVFTGYHYTKTRKLNAKLNRANVELQESNTVKDKLFSVLAHDLRSPLASIILLLEFINDDLLSEEEKKNMMQQLSVECNGSLEMLNNLLKWGQMQIKGVHLNREQISAVPLVSRAIALLTPAAGKKGIRVQHAVDHELKVFTDADHFEFIIRNLVSNAIKFTPEGGTVTISGHQRISGEAEIVVEDNGIGISPDRLNTIFTLSNVSTNGTNSEKGSSLGLLMCKEFVEANAGKIRVESTPGKGSKFIVTFPKGNLQAAPVLV